MRDKLIAIIKDSLFKHIDKSCNLAENIADDLLENGVVLLPCKLGQTVYEVVKRIGIKGHWEEDKYIVDEWAENIIREREYNLVMYAIGSFGKTVFLSREEAERALKGGATE